MKHQIFYVKLKVPEERYCLLAFAPTKMSLVEQEEKNFGASWGRVSRQRPAGHTVIRTIVVKIGEPS